MRFKNVRVFAIAVLILGFTGTNLFGQTVPALDDPGNRDAQRLDALAEQIRHELVTISNYSVFDWLEGEVKPDGTVTLRGQVSEPIVKSDAEAKLKRLESVKAVTNEIEVLPLSPADDDLRRATYRAIYNFDSPLSRYAMQAVPSMHILVKNGHIALKGIVDSEADSQLAYNAARQVNGAFSVKNELKVVGEESKRR